MHLLVAPGSGSNCQDLWMKIFRRLGVGVFGGSFEKLAGFEAGVGPDERDEMRGVDRAPAVLGGLDELTPGDGAVDTLGNDS